MDSKQAPPAYSDVTGGNPNAGYMPPAGDQTGQQGSYPPQTGYPAGYSQPPGYAPAPGMGYPGQQQYGYNTGYTYQQNVVVTQPMSQNMVVQSVPDHMGLAIFVTLCCCWPLGIVAILRAQESRRAVERGDLNTASQYSTEARRYSMWAIGGGIFSIIMAVVIFVVVFTTTINNVNNYDY